MPMITSQYYQNLPARIFLTNLTIYKNLLVTIFDNNLTIFTGNPLRYEVSMV